MPKNIVFCADGTWEGPGRDDDKDPPLSNVFKLFVNLAGVDSIEDLSRQNEQERMLNVGGELRQAAKYMHGVGDSTNFLVKMLGGTLGTGLVARILRGYTFVSRNYVAGDKIFLVGFSRGAYTARALAGMICAKGLLDASAQDLTDKHEAYRRAAALWYDYRKIAIVDTGKSGWLDAFERTIVDLPGFFSRPATAPRIAEVPIEAVAVLDTVGALGIPLYAVADDARIDALQFCNSALNKKVKKGLHGVSLDEHRSDFTPTLWDPDPQNPQRIYQVLFPGSHADVGGGYRLDECRLADGALQWLTQELAALGVVFDGTPRYVAAPDPKGVAHEPSSHPPFNLGRTITRQFAPDMPIHRSIDARRNGGPVVPDPGRSPALYAPPNVPRNGRIVA